MKDNMELISTLTFILVVAITYIFILDYRIEEFKQTAIKQECAKYNSITGNFEWKYIDKK